MFNYTFDKYQQDAEQFRDPLKADHLYCVLQVAAEAGELLTHYVKQRRGDPLYQDQTEVDRLIQKELGDILWSIAMIAKDKGWNLEDIGYRNIDKLAARRKAGTLKGSGDDR